MKEKASCDDRQGHSAGEYALEAHPNMVICSAMRVAPGVSGSK
jgi:hypothetical protein